MSFHCVLKNKENHASMERHKSDICITFFVNCSFKSVVEGSK